MENALYKEIDRLQHELAFERLRNKTIMTWLRIQVERMRLEGGTDEKS